jgi:hypothetical protein
MEAIKTSETLVVYQTTRRNILENYHLRIRRSENLKSHKETEFGFPVLGGHSLCKDLNK